MTWGPLTLALGTLASEDLACIAAGLLVAEGRLGFATASVACFTGIVVGDLLLFVAGRLLGRPAFARAPLRWLATPEDLARASRWLARRGPAVVIASRFLPGTRLPTYVAAGVLDTSFPAFTLWFVAAAAVWTPLLVGVSALLGGEAMERLLPILRFGPVAVAAAVLAVFLVVRLSIRLTTYRGRRLLVSRLVRLVRWEFWPRGAIYLPVALYALRLGIRHRGLTVFTAANPAIEGGGFVGESKAEILAALRRGGAPVAPFARIPASLGPAARVERAEAFRREHGLEFPLVVKPDVGERGDGVAIVREGSDLARRLAEATGDLLVQKFVEGPELGLFYARRPGAPRGRVLSVTEKRLPVVVADGKRTIERLVLDDPRGVAMARAHLRRLDDRLDEIPPEGTPIRLAEIGNHCKGAVFSDGSRHLTPALEAEVDRWSRGFSGFHFGRYDVRAPSIEAFREGRGLEILELNGVTSEATSIYEPGASLLAGWRTLFAHWREAYTIGAACRDRGARPATVSEIVRLLVAWVRGRGGSHRETAPIPSEAS